jgi:hypothetical protein
MIVYIQVTDTLGLAKLTIIGENPYAKKWSQFKRDLMTATHNLKLSNHVRTD